MTARRRRWIVAGLLLAAAIGGYGWVNSPPREPSYGGKKLSAWLDELPQAVHTAYPATAPPVQAVRAIGTNAIPWLLYQFRTDDTSWYGLYKSWPEKANGWLDKQHLVAYRFSEPMRAPALKPRLRRGTQGLEALGELAAPAIPELLKLMDRHPAHISATLVWIGRPAVPAVQTCLTNLKPAMFAGVVLATSTNRTKVRYIRSGGSTVIGEYTLTQIHNAHNAGRLSNSDVETLLPPIRAWATQTTNMNACMSALMILRSIGDESR